jgi:adenylosuccinate synthase
MPSLVIVGAQFGDEGKGKLVDYLSSKADWAARFHGGNNAGHTLVVNGVKTKLNLVPSGILRPAAKCLIGGGVVVDPRVLLSEIATLRGVGVSISPERFFIDANAALILPYHVAIDQARELALGDAKIGTTGRGIGPCYEDRAARCSVRFADLSDLDALKLRVRRILSERNVYLKAVLNSTTVVNEESVMEVLELAAKELTPYIADGSARINAALRSGERVVFEGAQGTYLDTTFGTFPFVTSSSTLAGAVCTGCGVGPKAIEHVLGVCKAYTSRVGSGPFPTELTGEQGDKLRERGAEYGTVTGRPRRCGWLDLPLLRRSLELNGATSVAITKLDVLSGMPTIQIGVGYSLDGKPTQSIPSRVEDAAKLQAIYREFPGWSEPLDGVKSRADLPVNAQRYLDAIEEFIGVPISMISVGAERNSTIIDRNLPGLSPFLED